MVSLLEMVFYFCFMGLDLHLVLNYQVKVGAEPELIYLVEHIDLTDH